MKKLIKTNLRWWGIILIVTSVASPAFSQVRTIPLPVDLRSVTSNLIVFQDALYMTVNAGPVEGTKLCKFDDENFTTIPNPRSYDAVSAYSPLVVYNGAIYVIITQWMDSAIPPPPALYRFDGTSYTRVNIPFDRVPTEFSKSSLAVYNGKLYVDVAPTELDVNSAWVAYDGTNFELIEFPTGMITNAGVGMTVYHDKLFCQMKNGRTGAPQLVSYDGTSFGITGITDLMETKGVVYHDKLILTQMIAGREELIEFDETAVSGIPRPRGYLPLDCTGEVYNGSVFLRMDAVTPTTGTHLMAYNGMDFAYKATVNGMGNEFTVWGDKLWFTGTGNLHSYTPTDDPAPYYDFERIDINLNAMGRGWCWNEIIIDWEIIPICLTPPDCPEGSDPVWVGLSDKDKEVWKSIEKKPFAITLPVDDNPYTFTLGTEKGNIITVDRNLVGMGLETVKLGLKPKEGSVNISLLTEKDKAVPITISFLNEKGVAVWQEQFVAPDTKQFTLQSTEPGAKFLISPAGVTLESAGITATSYYPNPFDGKITVDLQTKGNKIPVLVTIDDPNGKRVVDASLVAPIKQTLELKDKKRGFYVLTFSAGGASRQALIELK